MTQLPVLTDADRVKAALEPYPFGKHPDLLARIAGVSQRRTRLALASLAASGDARSFRSKRSLLWCRRMR